MRHSSCTAVIYCGRPSSFTTVVDCMKPSCYTGVVVCLNLSPCTTVVDCMRPSFLHELLFVWTIPLVDCVWNVMAHLQKPDFIFRRNGRVYLNRRGRQFSRLLAAEVCASAVVMLDRRCSEVVWRVLATHSIRQLPLHFPSFASPCAIRFQTHSAASKPIIIWPSQHNGQPFSCGTLGGYC